jgi:hypothetical protein
VLLIYLGFVEGILMRSCFNMNNSVAMIERNGKWKGSERQLRHVASWTWGTLVYHILGITRERAGVKSKYAWTDVLLMMACLTSMVLHQSYTFRLPNQTIVQF